MVSRRWQRFGARERERNGSGHYYTTGRQIKRVERFFRLPRTRAFITRWLGSHSSFLVASNPSCSIALLLDLSGTSRHLSGTFSLLQALSGTFTPSQALGGTPKEHPNQSSTLRQLLVSPKIPHRLLLCPMLIQTHGKCIKYTPYPNSLIPMGPDLPRATASPRWMLKQIGVHHEVMVHNRPYLFCGQMWIEVNTLCLPKCAHPYCPVLYCQTWQYLTMVSIVLTMGYPPECSCPYLYVILDI